MLKAVLLATLLLVPAAGRAQALPDSYRTAGALSIAMFPAFPPLAYRDPATGTMTGLDVELGEAIGADLGVSVKWVDVTYESAITSLKTGRIDLALSMVDLPESRDAVSFIGYIQSGAQFFTLTASKDAFPTPESLCGQSVGASRFGPFQRAIQAWSAVHCGDKPITAVGTEGSPDARSQMRQDRLQAVVQSAESLPYLMGQEPGVYTLVGAPFTDSRIAIGLPKDNTALTEAVRASLNRLIANGAYARIFGHYGLGSLTIGPQS